MSRLKWAARQINVMQLMAAGQADCTLGDNGQALETWQAGVHAVTVATVFQHSPTVFITHDKVNNPAELKDKTFLLATEAYTSFWPWAKSELLGLGNTKVRPYTFNVQPFLADKNLVQQGYVTSEPFSVAKGGQPFYVYPLSDWGYPPYGNSIICMADTIKKRPAAVAAFVKASMEGWKSYLQDPIAGNQLISKSEPANGRRADRLWHSPDEEISVEYRRRCDDRRHRYHNTQPRLKKTWDMLVKNKLIDASKVPFEQTYTLDMVKDAGVMP